MPTFRWLTCLTLAAGLSTTTALASRAVLDGPWPAEVTRIIDGDTVEVRVQVWLGQEITIKVRLAGVDAPELNATCPTARIAAREARDLIAREVEGARVSVARVQPGKYYGYVIGNIVTPRGEDLSALLLTAGLAYPYSGGRREPIC